MEIFETSGYPQLLRIIRYVRSRWRIRHTVKGIAYLLLFGLVAFAISAYGMEYFRYSAWSVRLFRIFTYLALVGSLCGSSYVLSPSGSPTNKSPSISKSTTLP